jgi:hypothetical protein
MCGKFHSEKTEFSLLVRHYYGDQIKEYYVGEESSTQVVDVNWMYFIPTL